MATYASYKKITGENITTGAITDAKIAAATLATWNVQWFYGSINFCSTGCCCLWTVPDNIRKLYIELWGAGGSGHGACSCNRCQGYRGAQGGAYANKMITVCPGWTYTVCAAGVYPCLSMECNGCPGCASYVAGCNLSNFCAVGGAGGSAAEGWWNSPLYSCWPDCCVGPTANGSDFGMMNHAGTTYIGSHFCHCHCIETKPTSAPFIGTSVSQRIQECWIKCGCWTVPYGHGGQGAMTTYCGACCGQGGTGGPGLVKMTYI
jgi:hypothetical protein